jgi:hypothetical protein
MKDLYPAMRCGAAMNAVLFAIVVLSQADAAEAAKVQQKKWQEFYQSQAEGYAILRDRKQEQRLEFKPDPVLHWTNPLRPGETNGSVFVWVYQGQVEAVGTVFSYIPQTDPSQRVIAHSFHSLSKSRLSGNSEGGVPWQVPAAGIQPLPIPGAPPPADSAKQRLTQMRTLARDFQAYHVLDMVEQELRLLPQPIYRNEKSSEEVVDGALFAFVAGTDPELMLLIEARQDREKKVRWNYSTGRFSDLTLILKHKKNEVWKKDFSNQAADPKYPYITVRTGTRPAIIE